MPPVLNDKEHVIYLIDKECKKRGRPVSLNQVAAVSSRPRDRIEAAFKELHEDQVIDFVPTPPGRRGRPTNYFFLKNKWVRPADQPFASPQLLVATQEPSEFSDQPFPEEHEPELEIPEDSDPFLIIGPQWIKLISKSKNSELNPDKVLDLINHFADKYGIPPGESVNIWNRLKKPEYDEYWTEYGIESVTKRRADGTRDRRYGSDGQVYALRHEVAPNLENKKEEQEHAQSVQVADRIDRGWNKTEEEAREVLQLPEPSADLPDMTAFKARLRAIMSE